MKIEKVYGNEIPPKFEYLRGGVFINALPEKVEMVQSKLSENSEPSETYSYYQTFTMETTEEILEKKYNQMLIVLYKEYLEDTKWYIDRFNDPSSGKAVPEEVLVKRAFAREEINRCEKELNIKVSE